jgi:hypothetical protein
MTDISGEGLELINELWYQTFWKKAFNSVAIVGQIIAELSAASFGDNFNGISKEPSLFSFTVNLFLD